MDGLTSGFRMLASPEEVRRRQVAYGVAQAREAEIENAILRLEEIREKLKAESEKCAGLYGETGSKEYRTLQRELNGLYKETDLVIRGIRGEPKKVPRTLPEKLQALPEIIRDRYG